MSSIATVRCNASSYEPWQSGRSARTVMPSSRVTKRGGRPDACRSLLGKLFREVLALLDDLFVVHPRSIAGQFLQIKTGYGEELRTTPGQRSRFSTYRLSLIHISEP